MSFESQSNNHLIRWAEWLAFLRIRIKCFMHRKITLMRIMFERETRRRGEGEKKGMMGI
jgi:hypothetical protein